MNTIFKTCLLATYMMFAGFCNLANAQEKTTRSKYSGGFGHFACSYESVNLSELNTTLGRYGYKALPQSYPSFGGAGYFVIDNILIGGGGGSLMGYEQQSDSTVVNMSSGYGFGAVGYVFSTGKRSFFYPNVGIGGGGFDLQLGKTGASSSFEEQLQNPRGRFFSSAGGLFYNVQLAWQTMLGTSEKAGWSIGIKAGYKFTSSDWSLDVNGQGGNDSPKVSLAGYYITITLGGGALMTGRVKQN
jgi:hypothetical protein